MKYGINESFDGDAFFPIFNHSQSINLEKKIFSNKDKEWEAMQKVAELTAKELMQDFKELRPIPDNLSIVVLTGKEKMEGTVYVFAIILFAKCQELG